MPSDASYRLQAGELRHLVTVQKATEGRDAQGGVTRSWTTHASTWASIRPLSGNERVTAMQVSELVTHRVIMRYVSGLTCSMRVLFGSRVLSLVNILDIIEKHKLQVCIAVEEIP